MVHPCQGNRPVNVAPKSWLRKWVGLLVRPRYAHAWCATA